MIHSINDVLSADAAALIDLYGEELLYRPVRGEPRVVIAIVERMGLSAAPPKAGTPRPWMRVSFKTDPAAGGLDVTTLDLDNDKIDIAYVRGGAMKTYSFTKDLLLQTPNRIKIRIV